MPGSGTRVEAAAVRGVASGGMLCCAYDLGWADEDDGKPAYVPSDVLPGTPFPDEPYAVRFPFRRPDPWYSSLTRKLCAFRALPIPLLYLDFLAPVLEAACSKKVNVWMLHWSP